MTVLSDREIRARIADKKLVLNGKAAHAEECSYAFRPGRAFLAGHTDHEVDFLKAGNKDDLIVEPGKMVWIRTREKVAMPHDLVGFWWQTNTLSRQGLMLVNMSMVEPGYEGDLACLLANFGNQKVVINKDTAISKMVFINISENVQNPFTKRLETSDYDSLLKQLSVNQPSSFLKIGEIYENILEQKSIILSEIQTQKDAAFSEISRHLSDAKLDAINEFKEDAPKAIRRSFAWAAGAIIVFGLITAVASWGKDNFFSDTKEIAKAAAMEALEEKMAIPAADISDKNAEINRKIDDLNKRLEKIEK